jgi:N-acyl-D-amino-acid deacylase
MIQARSLRVGAAVLAIITSACAPQKPADPEFDIVIRGGSIYDGTGAKPAVGDVGIKGDRITYLGPKAPGEGRQEIDATGLAVAPGFINQMSFADGDVLDDPRGQSDLRQGVTLEVVNEGSSPGPLNAKAWPGTEGLYKDNPFGTGFGEFYDGLEKRGTTQNIAAHVGAATVRIHQLGLTNADPTPEQLAVMRGLVRQAMEEGAVGVSTALIYAPGTFAKTDELVALAEEAGKCGGFYISHMRSEGDRFLEALDELIEISHRSGAPGEVFHIKVGGVKNLGRMETALAKIRSAREAGQHIRANMYAYSASGTGLDASMPPWVQEGGLGAWVARLKDPKIRKRVVAEMLDPEPKWENVLQKAGGAEGALIANLQNPALEPLVGKTLAQVAKERGVSPQEAAIDLVIEDHSRVFVIYFTMSDDNLRRQVREPYMTFVSDAGAVTLEKAKAKGGTHPREYGSFARVFAEYVRKDKLLTVEEAVHRLSGLPAAKLALVERGQLKAGYFADVVVFDPATIQDHATYVDPHQYATGVSQVVVNGVLALKDGEPTGSTSGRFLRGRAWKGHPQGGCRASSSDWQWAQ